jgi:hypothetical protein
MITTTLKRIKKHNPYSGMWRKLLEGLGKTKADDEPLPFTQIVPINGLDDALWCCRAEPQYAPEWQLFAVWCARQVQHLMKDPRSIAALDVAERYARGKATRKKMAAALTSARAASTRSDAEWYATGGACAVAEDAALAAAAGDAAAAAVYAAAAAAVSDYAVRVAVAAQTREFMRVVHFTEART